MNKLKAILMTGLACLMLSFGASAELAHATFGTTDIQQLTYGQYPVWRVTNLASNYVKTRFVQPSGFAQTLYLAPGEVRDLGVFESYYEWTCFEGGTPTEVGTFSTEPDYAYHLAGGEVVCK